MENKNNMNHVGEFGNLNISSLLGFDNQIAYEAKKGQKNFNITLLGFKNCLHENYVEGIYELTKLGKINLNDIEKLYNGLMNNCNANHKSVLGSTSDLFDQFLKNEKEKILKCKTFEELRLLWKEYYDKVCPGAIHKAAKKMRARRKEEDLIRHETEKYFPILPEEAYEETEKACYDYVAHLVYFNSPRGFVIERIILVLLSTLSGLEWKKSTIAEEVLGIDGKLGNFDVTIKPKSFFKQKTKSEMSGSIIVYEFKDDDLIIHIEDEKLWKYFYETPKNCSQTIKLNSNIISNK